MTRKNLGGLVAMIGLVLLLASLSADILGFGDDPAFGPNQVRGVVAGAVALVLGIVLMMSPKAT